MSNKKIVESRDLKQGLGFTQKLGMAKEGKNKKIKKL